MTLSTICPVSGSLSFSDGRVVSVQLQMALPLSLVGSDGAAVRGPMVQVALASESSAPRRALAARDSVHVT